MFSLVRLLFATVALFLAAGPALSAEPVSIAPEEGYLLLKNGNVLHGTIVHSGDRYYVSIRGGQLIVKAAEVEFQCSDLHEAYERQKKDPQQEQIGDHLKLAHWCLQNRLFDEAANELSAAKTIDAEHPRLAVLERQLQFAQREPNSTVAPASAESVPSADELTRLIRGMPEGTVHDFATSIQPMLINGCSTSNCHTERSTSEFKLLRTFANRPPSRRLTQRNLYSTLMLIDLDDVSTSPLLTTLLKPHGGMKAPIYTDPNLPAYQRLVEWCEQVVNRDEPDQPHHVLERSAPLLQRLSRPGTARNSLKFAGKSSHQAPRDRTGSNGPAIDHLAPKGDKPSSDSRTANRTRYTPRDEFDPEIFNRRYLPPAPKP